MKLILLLLCSLLAVGRIQAQNVDDVLDKVDLDDVDDSLEELLREFEEKQTHQEFDREQEIAAKLAAELQQPANGLTSPVIEVDPCEKMFCAAGRVCEIIDKVPKCVCITECPEDYDEQRFVCTNKNETWPSDCAVHQQRCLCTTGDAGCKSPDNAHLHIDYFGSCHQPQTCSEEDKSDFPRRMRDWLFNVMRDLAERDALTEHYMQMELEAETNMTRRWVNAAVWKWCDLDGNTDRSVSRHELFPIRAPLFSLEHCIAPFLESCDINKDHRITLAEWGACLQLEEGELNERCDDIQRTAPHLLG